MILKFAGYGFNKSHSTGYAIIAYQTAYLKTYFPNQYMAALLTYESAARKVESWVGYLEDCKKTEFADNTKAHPHVGVEVKPPDVNLSENDFTVVFFEDEAQDAMHGHVRFGLNAIRGSGNSAVGAIVAERKANGPFKSIFNFCERVELNKVNRATIETLIKGGAFDSLHSLNSRSAVFAAITDAISGGQSAAADKRDGQLNIFASLSTDGPAESAKEPPLPKIKPWDENETLEFEKEALGFYVSGHPLDPYMQIVNRYSTCTIKAANELPNAAAVKLAGSLSKVSTIVIQRGKRAGDKMARLTLQDKTGSIVGVVFTEPYEKHVAKLKDDAIVLIEGKLDRSRGELNLMVDEVVAIDEVANHYALRLELDLIEDKSLASLEQSMQKVEQLLHDASSRGTSNGGPRVDVMLHVHTQGKRVSLRPPCLKVVAGRQLIDELNGMLGEAHVHLVN